MLYGAVWWFKRQGQGQRQEHGQGEQSREHTVHTARLLHSARAHALVPAPAAQHMCGARHTLPAQEALRTRKPDLGTTAGPGRAGRIGATGGTLLTQHLMRKRGKLVSVDAEMDPRESILRHDARGDDAITRLTEVYAATQPKPIYAEPEPDSSEDEG